MEHAAGFPGTMFNAEGVSLNATIPDLTEEKLVEYPHRSMVARDCEVPVAVTGVSAPERPEGAAP